MEKLKKTISKKYLPVKIYMDDIEKIVSVLDDNSIDYSIETDHYKYGSVVELINASDDKKTENLKIQTLNPCMVIEFNKTSAEVYISNDEMFTTGLFYKIDEIIKQSKRSFPFFYTYYFLWIGFGLFIFESLLRYVGVKLLPSYIIIILYSFWFLWIARATYIKLVSHSSIQLMKKELVPGFFQRKRDDLILALLSALFGAITTILVTKFIN